MKEFTIEVAQRFYCTYVVQANSEDEAWSEVMMGGGDRIDQMSEDIISDRETSHIEETP